MNNQEFLTEVFGESTPVLASFPGDPGDPPKGAWAPVQHVNPEHNTFFCVSTFRAGRRRKENFLAFHCLVVDDVGTKVEGTRCEELLGEPTWVLETSPYNFQWGYLLTEPLTDRPRAERLINAVIEQVCYGTDPGMASVSRYVRMPHGKNWKPKHNGFQHKFEWLTNIVGIEELEGWLSIEGDVVEETGHLEELSFDDDPTALLLLGKDMLKQRLSNGWIDMTCPWVDEHTDAEDTGTAYKSPDGFRCHHGHCQRKTFYDLRLWLGEEVSPAVRLAALVEANPAVWDTSTVAERFVSPRAVEKTENPSIIENGKSWLQAGSVLEWAKDGVLIEPPPREWILDNILSRDSVAVLAGEGGVGKGRLLVNLCISLTTGAAWGPFKPKGIKRKVVYIGKEDDRLEQRRRFFHTARAWTDAGLEVDVDAMTENLCIPPFLPSLVLGEELGDVMRGTEADLIIVDPLMKFMDPTVSLNSQEGAGWIHNGLDFIRTACPGSCVMVVHHLNKSGRDEGHMHVSQMTGSGGITDLARMAMQMLEISAVRKELMGLDVTRRFVEGAITKSNYGPRTMTPWPFEMIEHGTLIPAEPTANSLGGFEVVRVLVETGADLTVPELDANLREIGMTARQIRAAKKEAVDKLDVVISKEGKKPIYKLGELFDE